MRCSKQRSLKTEQAQQRRRRDARGCCGCRSCENSHAVHENDGNTQMNAIARDYIYWYVRVQSVFKCMYWSSRSSALMIQRVHLEEHSTRIIITHVHKTSLTFQCLSYPGKSSRFGCRNCAYCYTLYFTTKKQQHMTYSLASSMGTTLLPQVAGPTMHCKKG